MALILITSLLNKHMILQGEILCQSLLGLIKGCRGQHPTRAVPLFTQVFKWVPANCSVQPEEPVSVRAFNLGIKSDTCFREFSASSQ